MPSSLEVGSLARMSFGGRCVVVFVAEDRGRLGPRGQRVFRVQFKPEATEDPIEMEVTEDQIEIVSRPNDPPDTRIGVEAVGDRWVGTYTDINGRTAIVTDELSSQKAAARAATRWVRAADTDDSVAYSWQQDPAYPGRYSVYRQGRLGPTRVRESA